MRPSTTMRLGIVSTSLMIAACSKPGVCSYEKPSCPARETCALIEPGKAACVGYVDAALELEPPFRSGVPFWCSQSGRSLAGRSHSFQGDLFALDLASTLPGVVEIVSPLNGTAYVFDGCDERNTGVDGHNDSRCGLGYGNHVKIWDGTNIYLVGHLARVHARPGPIRRDEPIGEMGCSGSAGARHVHVTVTRPRPGEDVRKILETQGWKGRTPVRYRLVARDAASRAPVIAQPDDLACADESARAQLFVR